MGVCHSFNHLSYITQNLQKKFTAYFKSIVTHPPILYTVIAIYSELVIT